MKMDKTNRRNQNISRTLTNSQWFMDRCDDIRKKYQESGQDEVFLEHEVRKLTKALPDNWRAKITSFIKTGVMSQPSWGTQIVMRDDLDKKLGWQRSLFVQIFKDTTLEDITKIWKHVKNYQKNLPEIWAPGFSDDDKLILDIWQEVESREKKPRNITREVSALLFERHNKNFDESDIRKRVSELKKQLAVQKPTKKNRQ